MRSLRFFSLALLFACSEEAPGGLTAHLRFAEPDAPGLRRQGLRTTAIPDGVGELRIQALDQDGVELASTSLFASPTEGQTPLLAGGGTWELRRVRSGNNRSIVARAVLDSSFGPLAGEIAWEGRVDGLTVNPGQVTNAGEVLLQQVLRIPELDFEGPSPPARVGLASPDTGGALNASFEWPTNPDVAGYVVALATTASVSEVPTLERGRAYTVNERLPGNFVVIAAAGLSGPTLVPIPGLTDGVQYTVLVFIHDDDGASGPLNYSAPALGRGTPRDTQAPGPVVGLTAVARQDRISFGFVGPGEDGAVGTPTNYQIRSAANRADVENGGRFPFQRVVMPPPPGPPGTMISFERSFESLGLAVGGRVFVGVRAVDAAENLGPLAVVEVTTNATVAPQLVQLAPSVAVGGREVTLMGFGFGSATGTVAIDADTSTLSYNLPVSRWTDTEVVVSIPREATSGRVTLTRTDRSRSQGLYLVVLEPRAQVQDDPFPFELLGDSGTSAALYRERGFFGPYTAGVERIFGGTNENVVHLMFTQAQRSTAIAGAWFQAANSFGFVASHAATEMTTAVISSSTVAPNGIRVTPGVRAGAAESVALVSLGGSGVTLPAMIAFGIAGRIRTATVADLRSDTFDLFTVVTGTITGHDGVRLASRGPTNILMAFRTTTGTVSTLSLMRNVTGLPSGFTAVVPATPLRIQNGGGAGLELRALPPMSPLGGYLIAYEDAEGRVRLLLDGDLDTQRGYAPIPGTGQRLEDVGFVTREGQIWVGLLVARVGASADLIYTEIPLSVIDAPASLPGMHPGGVLDSAPDDTRGRLSCKHLQQNCALAWMGESAEAFFLRR